MVLLSYKFIIDYMSMSPLETAGLEPKEICNTCCYKQLEQKYATPQWKDCYNSGKTYKPSYNICPKDVAPVLLSGSHFKINSRLIIPMVFGLIPQWAKVLGQDWLSCGSKYATINCRMETAVTSKLYSNLLEKGQRCAVICNGFYEWHNQKQSKNKKPYFIHGVQPNGVIIDDPKSWNVQFSPEEGFSGFRPLKLAALFEISPCEKMEGATFSFTIVTREADPETSWLHRRIPVSLETDEQLDAWLNYEEVNVDNAFKYICHNCNYICVPVSNLVNKVTNKDISCIKQEKSFRKKDSENFLIEWLKRKQE